MTRDEMLADLVPLAHNATPPEVTDLLTTAWVFGKAEGIREAREAMAAQVSGVEQEKP